MEVEEEDDDDYEDIEAPETSSTNAKSKPKKKNKGGRPRKSFAASGKSQKRAKLQDPYSVLEKASKEDDIDFPLLLGWLARYHYNKSTTPLSDSDKEWLELFDLISKGINPISDHSVSVEQGIYMTENLVYGREKWEKMKKCVEPHVKLPTQYKLRQFRDEYHPKTGKILLVTTLHSTVLPTLLWLQLCCITKM